MLAQIALVAARTRFDHAPIADILQQAWEGTQDYFSSLFQGSLGEATSTSILGQPSSLPMAFAPTGFTRMMQHEGEAAVARVAERIGVPAALSTLGTTSIEDFAAAAPKARNWFQLYVWSDHAASQELVERADAAG